MANNIVECKYIYVSPDGQLPENVGFPLEVFWSKPDTRLARAIGLEETGIAILCKMDNEEVRVFGKRYGVPTHEKIMELYRLTDEWGSGGGEGTAEDKPPMSGEDSVFSPGVPGALFNSQKTFSLIVLMALAAIVIFGEKE